VDISWEEIIRGKGKDIAVGLDFMFDEHFSGFGRSYRVSEYHNVSFQFTFVRQLPWKSRSPNQKSLRTNYVFMR
jgi:hypothetical protein